MPQSRFPYASYTHNDPEEPADDLSDVTALSTKITSHEEVIEDLELALTAEALFAYLRATGTPDMKNLHPIDFDMPPQELVHETSSTCGQKAAQWWRRRSRVSAAGKNKYFPSKEVCLRAARLCENAYNNSTK